MWPLTRREREYHRTFCSTLFGFEGAGPLSVTIAADATSVASASSASQKKIRARGGLPVLCAASRFGVAGEGSYIREEGEYPCVALVNLPNLHPADSSPHDAQSEITSSSCSGAPFSRIALNSSTRGSERGLV